MKNIYYLLLTTLMLVLSFSNMFAQSKRLTEISSDGDMNRAFIHYNEQNLADSIYQKEFNPLLYPIYTYRLIDYNEQGRISLERNFISLNDIDFFLADSVMITYDDKGRIATRLSYNREESYQDLFFEGAIQYYYDENGRLKEEKCYYDPSFEGSFIVTQYSYNENGLLSKKESPNEKTEYTYDSKGCVTSILYYKDGELNKRRDYKYDNKENLIERVITNVKEDFIAQKLYIKHDMSLLSSQVQYPLTEVPVDNYYSLCDNELYLLSKNAVTTIDVYSMHWWEGIVGKDHRASFVYEDHIGAGIEGINNSNSIPEIVVDNGRVLITNVTKASTVIVYDINGNVVCNKKCNYGTTLEKLPSGVYIISISGIAKKVKI